MIFEGRGSAGKGGVIKRVMDYVRQRLRTELTSAAFTGDGYYRSGDRVELTEAGELRYLGRVVDAMGNPIDGLGERP